MTRFVRLCDWLARLAVGLAAGGLVIMMAIIVWQVFARFVLNDSPSWSEPLAILLMTMFILLAAAVGVREGFHLGMSWGVDKLPPGPRRFFRLLCDALVGVFGVLMAVAGWQLALHVAGHVMPALGVSRAFAYVPMIVTGGLFAVFAVERILVDLVTPAPPPEVAAVAAAVQDFA